MKYEELRCYSNLFDSSNYELEDQKTKLFYSNEKYEEKLNNIIDFLKLILNKITKSRFSFAFDFSSKKMYLFFNEKDEIKKEKLNKNFPIIKLEGITNKDENKVAIFNFSSTEESFSFLCKKLSDNPNEDIDIDNFLKKNDKYPKNSSISSARNELNKLVGIEDAKDKITELLAVAKVNKIRQERGIKTLNGISNNMIFSGNPGTGKTTVAKLFAKAMFQGGVISKDKLVVAQRPDLVGDHVGETGPKTRKIIKSALGGVLFIDEAYSLYVENSNDFGQEAITELMTAMENYRNELIIILAGYSKEMETFLESNPGLNSRIPNKIYFADYNEIQLITIIKNMINEEEIIKINDKEFFDNSLKNYIRSHDTEGNGRWCRNFYQAIQKEQAKRIAYIENISNDDLINITNDDIINTLNNM